MFTVAYFFGCAQVEAGTMDEHKGTYTLTTYKYEKYDGDGNVETEEDYITKKGIKFYLVLTGTEKAYLAYQDNETPLTVREVQASYNYDYDNPELISSFEYHVYNNHKNYEKLYEAVELNYETGKLNYYYAKKGGTAQKVSNVEFNVEYEGFYARRLNFNDGQEDVTFYFENSDNS